MSLTSKDDDLRSIPQVLARNVRVYGDRPAYREKEFGIWQSWTWADAAQEIEAIALGLIGRGVAVGDHVAIIGRNRPALYWSMVAVQMCGGVPVPMYQDAAADEIAYALDHCGARFAIVGDQEQVDKIAEVRETLKNLEYVVYLDGRGLRKYDHSNMCSVADLKSAGRASNARADMAARIEALTYDSPCIMLYTSGTTGRPKGVVLSNKNVIETAKNSSKFDSLSVDEEILAYLPMAWVGDFIFSIGQAMWAGFCVNCPESSQTMMTDLREIGPTIFFRAAGGV